MDDKSQTRRPSILKRVGIEYLRGLDAVVRVIGSYVIVGIMYGAVWLVVQVAVRLPFGESTAATAFPVVALILTPFVIRYGLLAGGLEIPPIWKGGKRGESGGEIADELE